MKYRLTVAVITLLTACLLAFGCKKDEGVVESTSTETSTSVSSTDTSATTSTDSAATSTTGSAMAASNLSEDDRRFMEKAAIGGLFEVSTGSAVSPKAKKPEVKSFADRMVSDHSKASDELKQLATAKGVTLPADMDDEHKQKMQSIVSAADVDKAYMEEMAKDHDKDVKEFEEAAQKAQDPDLKAWIEKTLPVLKDHQRNAHSIAHGK